MYMLVSEMNVILSFTQQFDFSLLLFIWFVCFFMLYYLQSCLLPLLISCCLTEKSISRFLATVSFCGRTRPPWKLADLRPRQVCKRL